MGPVIRLLQAIASLTKSGAIKSLDDAYRLAKRELGDRFDTYKKQIKDAFDAGNTKPSNVIPFKKKEGIESLSKGKVKQKGEVIEASFKPGRDKKGNVVEESPSQASGLAGLNNPFRSGGGLDPVEGMTRTAARVVLGRRGIKIPERADPIDVFEENFGGDALMDLKNVGEELLEKQTTGNITESMGKFLEDQGMFDLKIDKSAPKTMSDEELLKKLEDDTDEAYGMAPKMVERFQLKEKYPGIDDELLTKIIDDPDPQNKAEALATLDQAMKLLEEGKGTDEIISILQNLKKTRKDNATGGRVQAASGGLAGILKL